MNEERGTVANLHVRSNLVSSAYQQEFRNLSAFELADIKRRLPLLPFNLDPSDYENVTPAQQRQWNARLFWGSRRIRLTEERRLLWLESQGAALLAAFETIGDRLGEEQAFEILYLAEQLRRTPSRLAGPAADLGERVRGILQGEVFGHTLTTIEQRLATISGDPDFRLERPDGHRADHDRP